MKIFKKILGVVLSVIMVVSMMPVATAFAADVSGIQGMNFDKAVANAKGYHRETEAVGGYDNILYCSKTTAEEGSFLGVGSNGNFKTFSPSVVVMMYDGGTVGFPMTMECYSSKSWGTTQTYNLRSIIWNGNANFEFRHPWYGYADGTWESWPGKDASNKATDGFGEIPVTESSANIAMKHSTHRIYNNEVYYKGTGNADSYYEGISGTSVLINVNGKTGSKATSSQIYVLDYNTFYAKVDKVKQIRDQLVAKPNCYTADSANAAISAVTAYYNANERVKTAFNSVDDTNVATTLTSVATDMKNAVAAIDNVSLVEQHTTEKRNVVNSTCTNTGYTGDDVCIYCGLEVSKGTETPAAGHDWVKGETIPPTKEAEGYTVYTCSVCQAEEHRDIVPVLTLDFTNLDIAVGKVLAIESNKYTVSSLEALAGVINSATYCKMTVAERENVDPDYQDAVDAEAQAIENAISALSAITVDTSAFESARASVNAKVTDPDAWTNVKAAKDYIDDQEQSVYADVTILNTTVKGVAKTQDEIDAVVGTAVSMVQPQSYTVYVDGAEYGTYPFGQFIQVQFAQKSDVFYSHESNTTRISEKYYTTDSVINFVIKGDTYLRTTPVVNEQVSIHKITYVNSLNNRVIAIDYVTDGENAVLPSTPSIAYYEFDNFYVNDAVFDGTNITANTIVTAVYNPTTSMPTIDVDYTYIDDNGDIQTSVTTYQYNDEVTLTREGAKYWIQFADANACEMWKGNINYDASYGYIDNVVYYGDTYTFRAHEDVYIAALTEADLEWDISQGYWDEGSKYTPTVSTSGGYIDAGEKISLIGTYKMYEDNYDFVEAGMLVAKNHTADLKDITTAIGATNGIYRLKSTKKTSGNQFVISLTTTYMPNGQALSYVPYMIYKDKSDPDNQIIIYGDIQKITYTK